MIFSAQSGYRVIAYRLSEDASKLEFDEYDVIAWRTEKNGFVPVTTGDLAIASDEECPGEGQIRDLEIRACADRRFSGPADRKAEGAIR